MFDNLKKLQQLREVKKALENERAESSKQGVKVTINGKMEVEEIRLNPDLDLPQQEELLRDCVNEAVRKMQMIVAQKMMKMQ